MVQKVQVKLFSSGSPDVEGHLPVFHRWIRDNVLGELMIDVVDYSHVTNGPELVLIGHGSDYAIDRGAGRVGLLYANKREPADPAGEFRAALRRSLRAATLLERETGPREPFVFRSDELLIRVADRLSSPNTDQTLAALEPELRAALDQLYAGAPVSVQRVGSQREVFQVEVRTPSTATATELLARIS